MARYLVTGGAGFIGSNIVEVLVRRGEYVRVLDNCSTGKPKNLMGAAFGSYGWTGEAVGQIEDALNAMKVELVADSIKTRYVPDGTVLEQCFSLGKLIAEKLDKACNI